jgi:hypothetical protein
MATSQAGAAFQDGHVTCASMAAARRVSCTAMPAGWKQRPNNTMLRDGEEERGVTLAGAKH